MSQPRLLAAGRRALARVADAARGRRAGAPTAPTAPTTPRAPTGPVPPVATADAAMAAAVRGRRDDPADAALPPRDPPAVRFDDEHDRAVLSGF